MSALRVVPVTEHRRVVWRNGLGFTTEILAEPSTGDWLWRLSLAESNRRAVFSSFPGIDRKLIMTAGSRLRLTSGGEPPVVLGPGESHRFAGEQEIEGEPLEGPTRQLNVMWRREHLRAEVTLHPPRVLTAAAGTLVLHCVSGSSDLEINGDTVKLHPGETGVLTAPDTPPHLTTTGLLTAIHFTPT